MVKLMSYSILLTILTVYYLPINAQTNSLVAQIDIVNANSLSYVFTNDVKQLDLNISLLLNGVSIENNLVEPATLVVRCQVRPSDFTFANVQFTDANSVVSNPFQIQKISFRITSFGQSPAFICSATVSSFNNQTVNGVIVTQLNVKQSGASILTILQPATIRFDSSEILISPYDLAESNFRILFRDTVVDTRVEVACVAPAATGNQISINIIDNVQVVNVGATQVNFRFRILNNGKDALAVRCTANSMDGGTQYTSTSATASLKRTEAVINIDGSAFSDSTSGSYFDIPIRLEPYRERNEINIECGIQYFDSASGFQSFRDNFFCPSHLDTITTSTTTRTTTVGTATTPIPTTPNYGTFNNIPYDWRIYDSEKGYVKTLKIKFGADKSSTKYIRVTRYPNIEMKSNRVDFLALYCCDGSSINNSPAASSGGGKSISIIGTANFTGTNFDPSNSPFATKYSSLLFTATLKATIDTSTSTALTNPYTFPTLLSPAYKDIATCICDLTPNVCDLNCCCDTSCSNADKQTFTECKALPKKLVIDAEVDYWNCTNPYLQREDWFPILCIQYSTSVIVGKYHLSQNLRLITSDEFSSNYRRLFLLANNYRSVYVEDPYRSIAADTQVSPYKPETTKCLSTSSSSYINGSCINTLIYKQNSVEDSNRFIENLAVLTLPMKFQNKKCILGSPVKYLMNSPRTFCESPIDTNTCTGSAIFDPNNYVLPTSISNSLNSDQKRPQVLKLPKLDINNIAKTYVEYYSTVNYDSFADNSALNVPSTPNIADSCAECRRASFIYDYIATNSCLTNQSDPSPNVLTLPDVLSDYNTFNYNDPLKYTLLNPTTTPNRPSVNGDQCRGVATQVKYVILWKDQEIVRILARVVTSDVDLNVLRKLKQSFELQWYPYDQKLDSILTMSSFEAYLNTQRESMLSGVSGYFVNKPVLSGKYDETAKRVDTSDKYRISGFLPNADNQCGVNNLRRTIKFGINMTSSCSIKINTADFKCSCLRKLLFDRLNAYHTPSEYVSRNGNPISYTDTSAASAWIKLIRQNSDSIIYDNTEVSPPNALAAKTCANIPTGIHVWFIFSEVGKERGQPINEMLATYVSYTYSTWQFQCKDPNNCNTNSFNIDFNAKFIDLTNRDQTALQNCNYSGSCIEDLIWIWTSKYQGEDITYLYVVNLSLMFGFISFVIIYLMIIGLVCPC